MSDVIQLHRPIETQRRIVHPNALVIAIDGPAASGKGTLAKRLAKALGLSYMDTGKLYRAVGYQLLQETGNTDNQEAAVRIAHHITVDQLKNQDLYREDVGQAASIISAIPAVRSALLKVQQDFAGSPNGAVLDGRDIGTVICPDAPLKFFITASLEARANRRYEELHSRGNPMTYEQVYEELSQRDQRDSHRKVAPLIPAVDAIYVDTTELSADEAFFQAFERVQAYVRDHKGKLQHYSGQ